MKRKRIVVLSGAGISVESGIDTVDGAILARYASREAWLERPAEVLEFCNRLRTALRDKEPNSAHRLLADMERDFDIVILTQNVDDLHERAGSKQVIHLHGAITKARPEDTCTREDGFSEEGVMDIGYQEIHPGDTGGRNHAQLRPHLVFFGEPVPYMERAESEVKSTDILLIVGTSLQVYPVSGLYMSAAENSEVYIIDPEKPEIHLARPVHFIQEKATDGMRTFAKAVGFNGVD